LLAAESKLENGELLTNSSVLALYAQTFILLPSSSVYEDSIRFFTSLASSGLLNK
jgi:hypothetical protein